MSFNLLFWTIENFDSFKSYSSLKFNVEMAKKYVNCWKSAALTLNVFLCHFDVGRSWAKWQRFKVEGNNRIKYLRLICSAKKFGNGWCVFTIFLMYWNPQRTKKVWCGRCAPKKFFFFFGPHFRVFFGRIAHIHVRNENYKEYACVYVCQWVDDGNVFFYVEGFGADEMAVWLFIEGWGYWTYWD